MRTTSGYGEVNSEAR